QALFLLGYLLVEARGRLREAVRHPQFGRAAAAGAVIAAGWLPWVPSFLAQRNHVQPDFWVREVSPVTIRDNAYQMVVEPECWPFPTSQAGFFLGAGCVAICIGAPLALLWEAKAAEWLVAVSALVPIGLSVLASLLLGTHIFLARYFLFAHLFILVSIA